MKRVRKHPLRLLLVASLVALAVTIAISYALYRRKIESTRAQLQLMVQFQVHLIESMASFDVARGGVPGSAPLASATLERLLRASAAYPLLGRSGELAFGYRVDGRIHILARSPDEPGGLLPIGAEAAESISRALAGESGSIMAPDHRGVQVLAAYAPVPAAGLGVVAKVDLAELRRPYLLGGAVAGALMTACVLLGALPALRSIAPLLRRLKESEDYGRSVLQTAVDGIISIDGDGTILTCNPAAQHLFGYPAAELIGRSLSDLMPEPQRGELKRSLARCAEPGHASAIGQSRTVRGLRKDGTEFPLELAIGEATQEGRRTYTAIVRDITQQQRAQEELRASQRLLQATFDTIPFPLTVKDRDSRYLMVNRGWLEHYGLSAEDALQRSALEIHTRPLAERENAVALDQRVLLGGEQLVVTEITRTVRTGERKVFRTYKTALRDERGELLGIISADMDITDALQTEQALRASQRMLRTVFETIPHTLVIKDTTGHYLMVNRAWREFYGLTEAQVVGAHTLALPVRPLPDLQDALRADQEALSGNLPQRVVEHMRTTGRGEQRMLQDIRVPLRDENGKITGLVALAMDVTERRQAQQELQESQRLLRAIFDTIPNPIYLKDRAGRYLMVNNALARNHRMAPQAMLGVRLRDLPSHAGPDADFVDAADRRVMEEGLLVDEPEVAVQLASGRQSWQRIIKAPYRNDQGEVIGLVGMAVDITERKKAEDELRSSEERFRNLIEGSIQGVLIIEDFQPIFANQAYADIFGYASPEDVLRNWSYERTFPPGERDRMEGYQAARMRGEAAPAYYEVQAMHRDGRTIWLETNARQIRWHGASATQITTHEITERKRAETELQASERRFRNLIEGSQQGIAIYRNGVPLFVNRAFAGIFGYDSPQEVMALRSLQAIVGPQDLADVQARQAAVGRRGQPTETQFQLVGVRRDGRRIQVEAFFQAIQWQGRRAMQVAVVDVSDRVHLEEQLRQAQKMEAVGQLAGGVAHDFNNILQIIRGYTELAQAKTADSPAAAYLQKVLKAAESASQVIRQLLAMSRRGNLQPRDLDINRLVGDLLQMVRRVIGEDIELVLHTDADPAVVRGDAAMLEQVLLNLCVNARDAMPQGGALTIRTTRLEVDEEFSRLHGWCPLGPYVAITVADTGVGIAPEDRTRIFEPFFTTKDAGKGTGLGLSMAYGIVQQHRGLMEMESEPGRGALFRIYLPAIARPAEAAPAEEPRLAQGGAETILVAEDEPGVLHLIVQLLESQGYRILKAADGEAALQVFQHHAAEIDLALLDMVMPKLSGRAVYDELQARRPDLPVLFSTGYTADTMDEDFVRRHKFYMIRKPYSPKTLFQAVREALDSPWPPVTAADEPRSGSARA